MEKKSKKMGKKANYLSLKFPSYLTSHTQPQNVRKYIANKERLQRMDKVSFNAFNQSKQIPKRDLTWPQAKIRYPALKPMRDTDKDGVINLLDCRPFDKRRQGFFHRDQGVLDDLSVGFEDIEKLKTIRDVQELEKSILKKEEK